MTTNSPNPVEGDVQALIAFLKEKVASLKLAVKQRASENVRDELVMELKPAEISLAALTAEPIEYLTWHQGCRAPDDCEIYAAVAEKSHKSDDGSDAIPVYTTPTAQLLRPVELPDIEENEPAFKAGLNSLVDCLEDCGDAEQGLRLALRSISEKWHEVKS